MMQWKQTPINAWLAEPVAKEVATMIETLAELDDVEKIAVMPDVHLAKQVCVGLAIGTKKTIYPAAVGSDIGCGMAAIRCTSPADRLADERSAGRLLAGLYRRVPSLKHRRTSTPARLPDELLGMPLSHPRLEKLKSRDGHLQFGTLGRGNRFLEFQSDAEGQLWLMVHSGSRGMGHAISAHHCAIAQEISPEKRLAGFEADSAAGRDYLADAAWAELCNVPGARLEFLHIRESYDRAVLGGHRRKSFMKPSVRLARVVPVIQLPLFGFAAIFLLALGSALRASDVPRPNLVFILTDDQRWNTLGCMGDPLIQTPNIDRLAAHGLLFRNSFVATSICCVSRASIFTGQHERRHGIGNFKKPLSAEQWAETYPALLRQAGYRTGFVGKFGVGDAAAIKAKADAFDFWRGLPGQAGEFFIDPKDPTHTHATARFGDQSLEFLRGCKPGRPFCLSLSFNAPHARDGKPREFQPDLRDEALYSSETIPYPPTAKEQFFKRLPDFVQHSECRRRWEFRFATDAMFQRTMRDYYRLVTGIDREVGRIVDALAAEKLSDNTVIIFTSDNGWFAGDRQLAGKWLMYEESIRVPLVVFDPRLPKAERGRTVDAITLNTDFAPTMLEMAGLPVPPGMQGRSLVPLLSGQTPADWRKEFFYEHHYAPNIIPPSEGVRTERWSYIHWLSPNPDREELYDLKADPLESRNLAADPDNTAVLQKLRDDWEKSKQMLK